MVRYHLLRVLKYTVMGALVTALMVTLSQVQVVYRDKHLTGLRTRDKGDPGKSYINRESPRSNAQRNDLVFAEDQSRGDSDDEGDREELPQPQQPKHSDPTLMIDDTAARELKARPGGRVLCWIPTTFKQMGFKVKAVNATWIQRCDGHIFFAEDPALKKDARREGVTTPYHDVVSLDVPPGYWNLTTKVVAILRYLHGHHLHDYDWFLKGDDDAYVIMENLRFLLAQYDAEKPVYLGHVFKRFVPKGYMAGGAAYVLSREALRMVVEEGYEKNQCTTKGRYEDLEVGRCLHKVGVDSHNSRDRFGRDTFHPLRPVIHIQGPIPAVQEVQDYFTMVSGQECCSQLTISFHKVQPWLMLVMDHLLYRTSVYGRVLDLGALPGLLQPKVLPPLLGEGEDQ